MTHNITIMASARNIMDGFMCPRVCCPPKNTDSQSLSQHLLMVTLRSSSSAVLLAMLQIPPAAHFIPSENHRVSISTSQCRDGLATAACGAAPLSALLPNLSKCVPPAGRSASERLAWAPPSTAASPSCRTGSDRGDMDRAVPGCLKYPSSSTKYCLEVYTASRVEWKAHEPDSGPLLM